MIFFNADLKFLDFDFGVGRDSTTSFQEPNQGKRYNDVLVWIKFVIFWVNLDWWGP